MFNVFLMLFMSACGGGGGDAPLPPPTATTAPATGISLHTAILNGTVNPHIPLYSDMHRFISAMSSLAGTNIAQIKGNHHPRRFGVSKYGITRIYKEVLFRVPAEILREGGC